MWTVVLVWYHVHRHVAPWSLGCNRSSLKWPLDPGDVLRIDAARLVKVNTMNVPPQQLGPRPEVTSIPSTCHVGCRHRTTPEKMCLFVECRNSKSVNPATLEKCNTNAIDEMLHSLTSPCPSKPRSWRCLIPAEHQRQEVLMNLKNPLLQRAQVEAARPTNVMQASMGSR